MMPSEKLEPQGLQLPQEEHTFTLNPNDGHLPPSAIPVSVLMEDDSDSSSYLYDSSEIEEDDVSDKKIQDVNSMVALAPASASTKCFGNGLRRHTNATHVYGETEVKQMHQQRKQGFFHGYVESLSSDSRRSLEFSQPRERSNGGVGMDSQRNADVRSYFYSSPHQEYVELDDTENALLSFHGCDQPPFGRPCDTISSNGSDGSFGERLLVSQANQHARSISICAEASLPSCSLPVRVPIYHASTQGPWHSVIAYDACVRLCLYSWATGCLEARIFLENECELLRNAFGLKQILLQSEEELLAEQPLQLVSEGVKAKPQKTIGKIKVQVREVKISPNLTPGCKVLAIKPPTINFGALHGHLSKLQFTLSSARKSLRKICVLDHRPASHSFSQYTLTHLRHGVQYIKKVSELLKNKATALHKSFSYKNTEEMYSCHLRLKSSTEDGVIMQPGGTHLFFPSSLMDDLVVEVYNSRGKLHGHVIAQLANISEKPDGKACWWSIYRKSDQKRVGKILVDINYTSSLDEKNIKCGSVAETVAYDIVLEVAMKVQQFQERRLSLHGEWKWLLTKFASYFGVSDAYTKLRYLSYVMDVATPTADCLTLVHDLLSPVIMKKRNESTLSHQENRILGEIEEQIEQVLAMVFENYKSLDESLPSGLAEDFRPFTGSPAPALLVAVKLYTLLHEMLLPEEQFKLWSYFQLAVMKRSRRHLVDSDEFLPSNFEGRVMDDFTLSTAYQKMKTLCFNMKNEILTDIEIYDQHVLPSFIDLPNLSASIYSTELCSRLRAFLIACPPTGPSSAVMELVTAITDFPNDLTHWNICPVQGGVDAKDLFHKYIISWIQDKRISLLDSCKFDKEKYSGVHTQHQTTPFIDEIHEQVKNILIEYEMIIFLWPDYTFALENAIVDIEKAVIKALEKQYADILAPLKCLMRPKKFGLKYVQKFAKRNPVCPYIVPVELGIFLNSIKRLLDVLLPTIEMQLKSWSLCIPGAENNTVGDRLSELNANLKAKFRNYIEAVVEKLAENNQLQNDTKLEKIIQDSKDVAAETDIQKIMKPLKEQLIRTINQLRSVFEVHIFVVLCRSYWDWLGKELLNFLKNQENKSLHNASRVIVDVLQETFLTQMQQMVGVGNALQDKDLEPPRSVLEFHSLLCKKDAI
ncbi:hypothetical protein IHE45_18G013900 [Dioscorea alata]|uniref:Uncharacterized protein n=1 Tax=Dioscorea alata TaxID=55571 RepID=A0ACB7U584_DIOAL|nr:hypothetical protein IHE45_18G013900 [Dioscorea alata]